MKLNEVANKKGTYAGVRFTPETLKNVEQYIKQNNIPNPLDISHMHSTLLYSRKYLPNYKAEGKYDDIMIGKPTGFKVWESQLDDDGKTSMCLVLTYKCPALDKRHEYLMKKYDAEYDYDDYKTHITFSYDVGDFDHTKLPDVDFDIQINKEYQEDLNLDWAKSNT